MSLRRTTQRWTLWRLPDRWALPRADWPERAPALNKIPLVKWHRDYAYVSSTHMLLPRGLNLVYDEWGGEKASGVLLHAKFIDTFSAKAKEELGWQQKVGFEKLVHMMVEADLRLLQREGAAVEK